MSMGAIQSCFSKFWRNLLLALGMHAALWWPDTLEQLQWQSQNVSNKVLIFKWGFPKMGVPLVIILSNGIFHDKPTIWGNPHFWRPPNMLEDVGSQCQVVAVVVFKVGVSPWILTRHLQWLNPGFWHGLKPSTSHTRLPAVQPRCCTWRIISLSLKTMVRNYRIHRVDP